MDNIIANTLPKALAAQCLYCRALEHLRLVLEGFASGVALESKTRAASPKQTDPEDSKKPKDVRCWPSLPSTLQCTDTEPGPLLSEIHLAENRSRLWGFKCPKYFGRY